MIEHVRPLSEALDWLAGNPIQIAAHAGTWRDVSVTLREDAGTWAQAVRTDLPDWSGTAGPAYRQWAQQQQDAFLGLATACESMAVITEGAGMLIGTVRMMVRDAIAVCVSRLVSYAIEEAASIGFLTPLVAEQVATTVAAWAAKIARMLRDLLKSLQRLMPIIARLGELIDELKKNPSSELACQAPARAHQTP